MKEAFIPLGMLVLIGLFLFAASKLKDELCRIRDECKDKWRIRKFIRENGIDERKLRKEMQ